MPKTNSGLLTSRYSPALRAYNQNNSVSVKSFSGRTYTQSTNDKHFPSSESTPSPRQTAASRPAQINVKELKAFDLDSIKGRVYTQRKNDKEGWKRL
jgi:hypothetical protein